MSRAGRLLCALSSLGVLVCWGQAGVARAQAPKLYSGSLSLHYFGNDTATRATPPFDAVVFTALPLGAHCNPAVTGGMTCDPTATLQVGAPLTGSGTALVGSGAPAKITLPAFQLARITSGSLPPRYTTQIYQKTYANLANAWGHFKAGGGPGSGGRKLGPATGFRVFPGKHQFGGVMNLLAGTPSGALGTKAKYVWSGKGYVLNFPSWGVTVFGGTDDPYVYPRYLTGTIHSTPGSIVSSVTGVAWGWPWTTGVVSAYASGDYNLYPTSFFPERLVRSGYDNRSPNGGGTIQLVAPQLTSWGALPCLRMGAIGVLRLHFAPEPSSLLLLFAGVGVLGLLYRSRARWRERPR